MVKTETLQTLVANNEVTSETKKTQVNLRSNKNNKEDKYFWYSQGEIVSDVHQKPDESIHSQNPKYTTAHK